MDILKFTDQSFDLLSLYYFFINSQILWVILAVIFLLYAIMSFVLLYHWRNYGMGSRIIFRAEIIYFAVSFVLFVLAIIFISLA